ncbi:MAG: NAD(P)/FAD-dependent oxidoreductase [Simkaniaceae bacterium]|nr:NAD(P)/FAD-dependent oxidoreductase [Simkaniaceae bacterium]MCF7852122.1 NAD(P)/FAD-dependent oxidoreductase [Simkaniaceae bacterium]
MHYDVVIVGGGFGGLTLVRSLVHSRLKVCLIDKKNHHLFQPLLYQVAAAALSPADIAIPLREILSPYRNVTVIMGEIIDVDKVEKEVILGNGDRIHFETLVLAPGACHSYFGHNEWEVFAPGLKTITDAIKIRENILVSFEKAERLECQKEAEKYLNFVIIGGGPTGVEMAGAIAEIAYKTMFQNFRQINPEKANIYLVEGMNRLLPPYPESLSARAKRDLEKMNVKVMTNQMVTNVTSEGVEIGDEFIPCKNVIWAAGNQASPLLKKLDVELTRAGTVIVNSDLSIPNCPNIFVIGDAACFKTPGGHILPGIAPVAIQQGKYLSKIIKKKLPQTKRKPFTYFDKGSMATIGKAKAVGFIGKIKLTGFIAWLGWLALHVLYLAGFRNRLSVALQWFFHYVGGMRGARIIYRTIDEELPQSNKVRKGWANDGT